MTFLPTCGYRTTLSQGDHGHDVAALQLNLNAWRETQTGLEDPLVEDAAFGGRTYRRVRTFQRRRGLWIDGVAGFLSQRALALELLEPASDLYDLPDGMLKGQTQLESTFAVGAVNCRVAGAKDCGWTQRRVQDGSDSDAYEEAFDGPTAFTRAAAELRTRKENYYNAAAQAIKDHEYMWKAAVLAHNWPAAAQKLASFSKVDDEWVCAFDGWRYKSGGKEYGVDDPAPWVINIGVPGVETGRQWKDHYIGKVTVYCQEYGP